MTRLSYRQLIRFRFEFEKALAAIAYLAAKLGPLDKLRLCKLVYLADRRNLVTHGLPITGDQYAALDYGPVPSTVLDLLNDMIDTTLGTGIAGPEHSLVSRMGDFLECAPAKKFPTFAARRNVSLDSLSEVERESLDKVVQQYGQLSAGQLIDLAHQHAAWKRTARPMLIDYRLFFEDNPEADDAAREYMELTQEDRDLELDLND